MNIKLLFIIAFISMLSGCYVVGNAGQYENYEKDIFLTEGQCESEANAPVSTDGHGRTHITYDCTTKILGITVRKSRYNYGNQIKP